MTLHKVQLLHQSTPTPVKQESWVNEQIREVLGALCVLEKCFFVLLLLMMMMMTIMTNVCVEFSPFAFVRYYLLHQSINPPPFVHYQSNFQRY